MNRILPRHIRTRIPTRRTPGRGARLRRRIGNGITAPRTPPLKRVIQPEPMPHFVRNRIPQVIVRSAAPRDGGMQNTAPVVVEIVAAGCDGRRKVAVAEVAAEGFVKVDVEVAVGALAEGLFHGELGAVVGPVGVDGEVGGDEGEGEAVGGEGVLEDGELVV